MKLKPLKNYHDYTEAKSYLDNISKFNDNDEILSILVLEYERKLDMNKDNLEIEPLIDSVFDLVEKATKYEKTKGLSERCLKLGEEYGELSAEILKLSGYKRSKETKEEIRRNILLESSDCLIMIFDIMIEMGFTKKEITDMSDSQIKKWISIIQE